MKLASALALSWVSLVAANFDVYLGDDHVYFEAIRTPIIQIFDTDPSCDDVRSAKKYIVSGSDNVSGNRIGYVCEGDCAPHGRADGITRLEISFSHNPHYHFTLYKDRNYALTGTDDQVYGECFPFPGNSYICPHGAAAVDGVRKFRCLTHLTAAQIQAAN